MNRYIKGRISKGQFVSELFKQRVESIGGTYEANDCLINTINSLTDREFKDAKAIITPNGYLVDKLPTIKPNGGGDATVVRNTTKTRVNSSGLIESMAANVLAPDYLNGVCPTINVEAQTTNLLTFSEDFANADYTKFRTVVSSNATTSPDGTINADKIIPTTEDFNHSIQQFVGSLGVSLSFFVKAAGYSFISVGFNNNAPSAGEESIFNINNGTLVSSGSDVISETIDDYGNGWYRLKLKSSETATASKFRVAIMQDSSTFVYSGDGVSGVFLWGAQLKKTLDYTSYIPTTTAAVTRSADNLTIPIPTATTEIIEKYEDGTTNTITTIPASPYTVPTGKRYEYILMR